MSNKKRYEYYNDAEKMADDYLKEHFDIKNISFPINPFKLLADEGVIFAITNLKIDGFYKSAENKDDVPLVGIKKDVRIIRQRYTAAHELCHHLKDNKKEIACAPNSKDEVEIFAEDFAAALLMPVRELEKQVNRCKSNYGKVDFDSIVIIAEYFGVSFLSCAVRIFTLFNCIEGCCDIKTLLYCAKKYSSDDRRKEIEHSYVKLYDQLFDCYENQLRPSNRDFAKNIFQNTFIMTLGWKELNYQRKKLVI